MKHKPKDVSLEINMQEIYDKKWGIVLIFDNFEGANGEGAINQLTIHNIKSDYKAQTIRFDKNGRHQYYVLSTEWYLKDLRKRLEQYNTRLKKEKGLIPRKFIAQQGKFLIPNEQLVMEVAQESKKKVSKISLRFINRPEDLFTYTFKENGELKDIKHKRSKAESKEMGEA